MSQIRRVGIALAVVAAIAASYGLGRHNSRSQMDSKAVRQVLYYVDPMHPAYKSAKPGIAPDCGMELKPVYAEDVEDAPPSSSLAQSPPAAVSIDGSVQRLMGIQMATAERSGAPRVIRVVGRVVPEDTRVYRVNSGMDGFVRETFNDSVGVMVKKDQKLATSYGSDSLAVASGFLAATERVPGFTNKDGQRTVPFPGAVSKQGVSSLQGYTDRLRNLGLSEVQIREIAESRQLPESIDIVAPADGFILARNITPGQHFDRSMEFYRIADLSRVWIVADLFGSEAQNFRPGSSARVTLPDQGKTLSARVSDVLPQVDPATRTLKLRLEADNPGFVLRPDMFVDVELPVAMPAGLTVPLDAVLDSGRGQRVFVERSSGVFEPRPVQTGWRSADRVEITHGLVEGERVVAAGTFLVDSESRLKSAAEVPLKHEPDQHQNGPAKSNGQRGLAASAGKVKVKDAACGMMIDPAKAIADGNTLTRDGVTYYFCSDSCKKKFDAQPEHYLALNPSGHRP
jgi:Cu(I)/Ag(I) efflux system membrane fusion protein